jgi:hypothetical protein
MWYRDLKETCTMPRSLTDPAGDGLLQLVEEGKVDEAIELGVRLLEDAPDGAMLRQAFRRIPLDELPEQWMELIEDVGYKVGTLFFVWPDSTCDVNSAFLTFMRSGVKRKKKDGKHVGWVVERPQIAGEDYDIDEEDDDDESGDVMVDIRLDEALPDDLPETGESLSSEGIPGTLGWLKTMAYTISRGRGAAHDDQHFLVDRLAQAAFFKVSRETAKLLRKKAPFECQKPLQAIASTWQTDPTLLLK